MSINYQILGKAGRDNILYLRVDSGNKLYRILIDCGEDTVSELQQSDVKSIDFLLLSHLHLDHIAGFDYLFRRTFDRNDNIDPLKIYGPEDTSSIMHNRFRGFKWNLTEGLTGVYYVGDILDKEIKFFRYKAATGFSEKDPAESIKNSGSVFADKYLTISAAPLNHRIASMGYSITETDSINVNKEELLKLNFEPGPWLNTLKDFSNADDQIIKINEKSFRTGTLREQLITITPRMKVTYLTDFIFDDTSHSAAVKLSENSDALICESQYLKEDQSLAERNYHLTSVQAAAIAAEAEVKKLILFHVSERYIHNEEKMKQMLNEARSIFPETYFPEHWNIHQ